MGSRWGFAKWIYGGLTWLIFGFLPKLPSIHLLVSFSASPRTLWRLEAKETTFQTPLPHTPYRHSTLLYYIIHAGVEHFLRFLLKEPHTLMLRYTLQRALILISKERTWLLINLCTPSDNGNRSTSVWDEQYKLWVSCVEEFSYWGFLSDSTPLTFAHLQSVILTKRHHTARKNFPSSYFAMHHFFLSINQIFHQCLHVLVIISRMKLKTSEIKNPLPILLLYHWVLLNMLSWWWYTLLLSQS